MKNKLIVVLVVALFNTSCGVPLTITSPWGDISEDAKGNVIIAPKPIVVEKNTK
jgi:hypothetical protein